MVLDQTSFYLVVSFILKPGFMSTNIKVAGPFHQRGGFRKLNLKPKLFQLLTNLNRLLEKLGTRADSNHRLLFFHCHYSIEPLEGYQEQEGD
jgi:hypothetical protein